jgi:hypothetical protein
METQKSFYMTLPSNVKSFHDNRISHFSTILPRNLNVRNYEVALKEICYPHSFDNIYEPINEVSFTYHTTFPKFARKTKHIPPGYYKTMDDVAQAINALKPRTFKGEVSFEKFGRKRAKIVLFSGEMMKLHPTLAQLLGFDDDNWVNPTSIDSWGNPPDNEPPQPENSRAEEPRMRYKATRQGNMNSLYYNMFVYSSVCSNSIVGNSYLPLLRTINVEGKEGDYIQKTFDDGHYVKVQSDLLSQIDIKITNDQGELVKFTYGKIIVKLHFRKITLYT